MIIIDGQYSPKRGSPALAGIDRGTGFPMDNDKRFPRTRGDRPIRGMRASSS